MITSSKNDYIRLQHPFIFHFLINFYKYLREPFYHIKREGKTSFFWLHKPLEKLFWSVCQRQENLHRLKFAPKIRYSLFEKGSFEGKTPSMTSTKLLWAFHFILLPKLVTALFYFYSVIEIRANRR